MNIFIIKLHNNKNISLFLVYKNGYIKNLYNDIIQLQKKYTQGYNLSITTTNKEINFHKKQFEKIQF